MTANIVPNFDYFLYFVFFAILNRELQVNYYNYSTASKIEKGYSPGVVIEILEELGQMLNLTYEYIYMTDNVNGYLNDSYDKIFTQNVS